MRLDGAPRETVEQNERVGGPAAVVGVWDGLAVIDHAREAAYERDVIWPGPPAPLTWSAAQRLRGTYAIAAVDGGDLVLARGALGGRSLYYARDERSGAFLACSRFGPLATALGLRAVDADRLATTAVGAVDPEAAATHLAGIARVRACEAIRVGASGVESAEREMPRIEELPESHPEDIAEQLWAQIRYAVRRALAGQPRIAVMAGGGVDSSALLAAAVAEARGATTKDVLTIAVDFAGPGDDRPYMRDLCDALGIVPIRLKPCHAGRWFAESLVIDGAPYGLLCGAIEQLVFRRAREEGAEALLTGGGGDEVFAGDMRELSRELAKRPLQTLWSVLQLREPWETSAMARLGAYLVRPAVKPFLPVWIRTRRQAYFNAREYRWAGPRLRRALARAAEAAHACPDDVPRSPSERYRAFATRSALLDFADWRAQMEVATGCMRLEPFQDDELLEFISRIPVSTLMHGKIHRGLLRLAMRGRVPDSIRGRNDKAFWEVAFAESARDAGGVELFEEFASPRALESMEIVAPGAFRPVFDAVLRDPCNPQLGPEFGLLWTVATAEAFAREKLS
jgi:asparagine synthase (glutamine-hydrolysing)